ncbi:hypothetical protein B566_EDAN017520 [Ephemera danica]|nr:hypothetical protein B566_EDAN017520 [Ephemera danica]
MNRHNLLPYEEYRRAGCNYCYCMYKLQTLILFLYDDELKMMKPPLINKNDSPMNDGRQKMSISRIRIFTMKKINSLQE